MKAISVLLSFLLCLQVHAQSFNNNEKYDDFDMKVLFELMKLEVFKFTFEGTDDSCLNIKVIGWNQGVQFPMMDWMARSKELTDVYVDDDLDAEGIVKRFHPRFSQVNKQMIRIYTQEIGDSLLVTVKHGGMRFGCYMKLPAKRIHAVRAYDAYMRNGKDKYLCSFYGHDLTLAKNAERHHISCETNSILPDMAELTDYGFLVVVQKKALARKN